MPLCILLSMVENKNTGFGLKSFSLMLLVFIICGWLSTTFYVAGKTEESIRAALTQQKLTSSHSLYFDIVDYNRSLFSAYAIMAIKSRNKKIQSMLQGMIFRADIKHGPLLFNHHNVQFAVANLDIYIDKSYLSEDMSDLLERLFADTPPISMKVQVDYDLKRRYQFLSAAFEYDVADVSLKFSPGKATGVVDGSSESIPINFTLEKIMLTQAKTSQVLVSKQNLFSFDLFNQLYPSETFIATIAEMYDANYIKPTFNLENIQLEPLLDLLSRYERRYNLDQQITWTLEQAMQSQEGQDRLLELFQRQEELALPEMSQLVNQIFKQGLDDVGFLRKVDKQNRDVAYSALEHF